METDLRGALALVTGAASGIGRATAFEFAREGARLILVDVNDVLLGRVAAGIGEMGAEAHTFGVDLTDWDQVRSMADTVHSRWGALDVLVNCAGIIHMAHLVDTTPGQWRHILDVNLMSMVHTVSAFAPSMINRGSGHIVNISSGQAYFAVPMSGAYAATKYAVDGYSEALRYELYWHGIRVTTVYPGLVRTHLYDNVTGGLLVRASMRLLPLIAAKPDKLGRMIVKAVKKNKRSVNQSAATRAVYLLKRVLPWPFEAIGLATAWLLRNEKGAPFRIPAGD